MTEDSDTLFLDLANNFPQAEESQTRHKESTPKTFLFIILGIWS